MLVAEALAFGAAQLPRRPGLPDPRREARWLLARAWEHGEEWVVAHPETVVPAEILTRYRGWLERRAAGEPAHHLTGWCRFWGRQLAVSPAVLVPRPETELLVQAVLDLPLPFRAEVVDVGTGSGCIALTLALERPGWEVVAVDFSLAAAALARGNAYRHTAPVAIGVGDLTTCLGTTFDLVVANPPYVPSASLALLPLEVRSEPTLALDGGADGLELVRRLLGDAVRVLSAGGFVVLELGEGQANEVAATGQGLGFRVVRRVTDLGGCDRVLVLVQERGEPEQLKAES